MNLRKRVLKLERDATLILDDLPVTLGELFDGDRDTAERRRLGPAGCAKGAEAMRKLVEEFFAEPLPDYDEDPTP